MDENKKIVAIYCRVSTREQAEAGYSIDEQERILLEYCEKNKYQVYKSYSDKGISGKDIKHRPAMCELLQDAQEHRFSCVISWKINRISRRLSDAIKIVDILDKNGIAYRSYSEPFESDTPTGKMQFQMMALIGEFERSTIAQNVKMGMCAKARSGEWCGGVPPFGYEWKTIEDNENVGRRKSKLVICEREAEIVKLIFQMYADGKGYKAIVNYLNKQGYKTKHGNDFSVGPIRDILLNPVYIGMVRYNVRRNWNEKRRRNINPNPIIEKGIHEPIIDKELWDRVQAIYKSKQGRPSRIYDGEYPLTGILRCPECGAGMVISRTTNTLKDGTKKRIVYYACGNWKNKGTAVCHSNSIRVEKANKVVYREISKVLSNENVLKRTLEKVNEENNKRVVKAKKCIHKCKSDIEKIRTQKSKLMEAYETELINGTEFIERKGELEKELQNIENEKEQQLVLLAQQKQKEIPYEYVKEVLNDFSMVLESNVSRELKKNLLHMLIKEITIDKRREIDSIKISLTDDLVELLDFQMGKKSGDDTSNSTLKDVGLSYMDLQINI